tara:strand:- start:200 stop:1534 length:1335 start_codon:yes stop_codon:yes gene_type:complete
MATNRDLLKEAIADAKAVKEMAIANAKTALEEAFTPRLKEMLSAKIQEMDKEEDDVKEMKYEEDDDSKKMEEEMKYEEDNSKVEESMYEEDDSVDEMNLEELLAELEEEEKEKKVDEGKKSDEDKEDVKEGMYEEDDDTADDDMDEEGEPLDLEDMTDEDLKKMIEDVIADMIDSGELEAGEGAEEEGEEMEMSDEEEDVDLTELLKEIEEEMEEKEKETVDEMDDSSKDDKIEKEFAQLNESESLNEEPLPSGPELAMILSGMAAIIGSGVGFVYLQSYIARKAKEGSEKFKKIKRTLDGLGSAAGGATRSFQSKGKLDETDEVAELQAENESLKTELSEAVKTTNATNLLNAKLLYTNKIFKSKNLNESQKVKVLSSFDKANTVKESKLIYETLSEGLKTKKSNIKENLGRASKATTIPTTKKPIVESNDVFARMQKLAGIK